MTTDDRARAQRLLVWCWQVEQAWSEGADPRSLALPGVDPRQTVADVRQVAHDLIVLERRMRMLGEAS